MNKHPQQSFYLLPYILFIVALCFLVNLLFTIEEDVFFSGDAGLKFLMVKQIAHGGSCTTLDLESPQWVNKIWSQGFYPLKAPFIYDYPQGKIVSFPPYFQWLTSQLYKRFGFKGIYIIPSLSIAVLWYWFIVLMQKTGVGSLIISAGFFMLAFCSPLTVYGAAYWEHSIAIVLLFSALVFLLAPSSILQAATLGLMTGMSVWFRPEMLLICLLLVTIIAFDNTRKNNLNVIFTIALLFGIATFLTFNFTVYGSVLGAHSNQLFEPVETTDYFSGKLVILTHLNGKLIIYFPLMVLFYALSIYIFFKRRRLPAVVNQFAVVVMMFLMIAPFALPNAGGKQWGPRYFLPVVPMVIVTLCLAVRYCNTMWNRSLVSLLLLFTLPYSLYVNVYLAHRTLSDDYAYRVKPALDFLKNQQCDILIVQNQYISQEFAQLFEKKKIFLAESQRNFDELKRLLTDAGMTTVLYISHDGSFKRQPVNLINNSSGLIKAGDYYLAQYDLK